MRNVVRRALQVLLMVALVLAGQPRTGAQTGTAGAVNFNFDQVELRLLIKLVGDMTGKRFVIDKGVNGKVTVVTPTQIAAADVYPLFVSILESSGYTVAQRDDFYHVVPLAEGALPMGQVIVEGSGEGLITKVIRLENISAVDLKKVLEPLVRGAKVGAVVAFGPTNHLIVTDTAGNIRRLEEIIAQLDKPGAARAMEYVKLDHASAEEVARQLTVALRGTESAERSVGRHFQQVAEGGGTLPADVMIVPAPQANSLVLVGTSVQLAEMKRMIEMMDVEPRGGYGRLNAIFLKYLPAEQAAKNLNNLLARTVDKDQRQRIAIEPSLANNALLIEASPQDFDVVRGLVNQLDLPPQQVMVEILIAEVALGRALDLGVEWSTIDAPREGSTTVIGRSRPGDTDQLMDIVTKGVFPQGLTLGVARGTFVDATGAVVPRVPLLIRALAENRDVKILSSIPLWSQNNIEASVSVVENIPILRSTIEAGAGTARDVIQNIDRMDVGMKLKFTPYVNPDREVTMQLNPSIEAVIDPGSESTMFTPTIARREVSTTVTIPDKATVVISGLIREDNVKTISKIPLLGDIPLLGALFRRTVDNRQRTNLLIFVTPHIVTDMESAMSVRESLEERMTPDLYPSNAVPGRK